jgi:hypothetical protein
MSLLHKNPRIPPGIMYSLHMKAGASVIGKVLIAFVEKPTKNLDT